MGRRVEEVAEELRRRILDRSDERFMPGNVIPSGRSLEAELRASRVTVQKAINSLIDQGVLVTLEAGLTATDGGGGSDSAFFRLGDSVGPNRLLTTFAGVHAASIILAAHHRHKLQRDKVERPMKDLLRMLERAQESATSLAADKFLLDVHSLCRAIDRVAFGPGLDQLILKFRQYVMAHSRPKLLSLFEAPIARAAFVHDILFGLNAVDRGDNGKAYKALATLEIFAPVIERSKDEPSPLALETRSFWEDRFVGPFETTTPREGRWTVDEAMHEIQRRIRTGTRGFEIGSQTPSTRTVAKMLGAALNTVQQAVRNLSEKGVLVPTRRQFAVGPWSEVAVEESPDDESVAPDSDRSVLALSVVWSILAPCYADPASVMRIGIRVYELGTTVAAVREGNKRNAGRECFWKLDRFLRCVDAEAGVCEKELLLHLRHWVIKHRRRDLIRRCGDPIFREKMSNRCQALASAIGRPEADPAEEIRIFCETMWPELGGDAQIAGVGIAELKRFREWRRWFHSLSESPPRNDYLIEAGEVEPAAETQPRPM